ncbi:hypothetical protein KFE94_16510 [bacterium SCSIO 12643]|nr:hypothetical protein KFE94_16510 [bacterium SCSIO 12643]
MKNIYTPIVLIIALLWIPFNGKSQLNCYSLQAPTIMVEGMEKIAIMNFENRRDTHWYYYRNNDYGAQLADYMIASLLEKHRGVYSLEAAKQNKADLSDITMSQLMSRNKETKLAKKGKNYMERYNTDVYTVVERGELDKVMQEQKLGASGAISDADATEVGKLLGLDVMITGNYSTDVKTSVKKSGSGSGLSYNAKKIATVDVTMKIISIETGEILSMVNKTATLKKKASGSSYSEASSSLSTDGQIIRSCLKDVAKQLVSHFAPTFVYQELAVEKPAGKGYKDDFKKAKDLVKENDLSGAFAIVKKVYDKDPYDAAMAHNMGVLYEAVGNFDQAIEYHKAAYEIDPSKEHNDAMQRAMNSKEALKELERLGVDASPYQFDESAGARLNMQKVQTIGKKTDRYDVYIEANKAADIAAKVPGSTEFVKLGEEGNWVKIKLIGGKEGFIDKKYLKK